MHNPGISKLRMPSGQTERGSSFSLTSILIKIAPSSPSALPKCDVCITSPPFALICESFTDFEQLQQLMDALSSRNNDSYSIMFNLLKQFKEWSVERARANTSKERSRSDTSCTKYKFHKDFFDQPFPDQSNSILQVCLTRLKMDEKRTSKLLQKVFNFWTVNYEHKIIVLRTIHDLTKTGEERPKWIHKHFQQNRFVPKKDKRNLSKNARPYGTHCEQFVSKDDIQKYVSNICVHMLHTNQFKVDPGCNAFHQLSQQLLNFCRQVYINPHNIKISKYNVLILHASLQRR